MIEKSSYFLAFLDQTTQVFSERANHRINTMASREVENRKGSRSFCAWLSNEFKKMAEEVFENTQYKVGLTKTDIKKINPTF